MSRRPLRFLPPRNRPLNAARIHLDQCMPNRLARLLRQHGLDVTTTASAGITGADDRQQLSYARKHRRLLLTRDRGFAALSGKSTTHAGILICPHNKDDQRILHFVQKLAAKAANTERAPIEMQQE